MANGSHIGDFDPLALVYMLIVFAAALLVPALIVRFTRGHSDSDGDNGDGGGGATTAATAQEAGATVRRAAARRIAAGADPAAR